MGGCPVYNHGPHQYTERQMERRLRKVGRQITKAGGVDNLLSHAPAAGWGDADDFAHRGFECFNDLLDKYQPK